MKKVLYVIDHIGGGHSGSFLLKIYNNKHKFNSVKPIFYSLRSTEYDPPSKTDLIISSTRSKWNPLPIFELKKLVKSENIKILHLYLEKAIVLGTLLKITLLGDLRIVVHEHGRIFKQEWWYGNFLRFFQSSIDLFIAVSEVTKKRLVNAGVSSQKIVVVNNFADFSEFDPLKYDSSWERKELGFMEDDLVVAYVGRLIKLKNVDQIIKALALKKNDGSKRIKLVIVGDGPGRKSLMYLTKSLGLSKDVRFLGYKDDVARIISATDIGCLVSEYESFGLPILEYLAMGKRVIATSVGIAEEVADLIEIVSKENLATEISKAISKLSNAPMISDTNNVLSRYSAEHHFSQLDQIYARL